MKDLLPDRIFNGFYIWFDFQRKEEYFATPLYLYGTKRKWHEEDETRIYLELEQDIFKKKPDNNKREWRKQPSTIYIHYAESIGMLLINLLNADFSTFESAYTSFLYAYGLELLKNEEHFLEEREPLTEQEVVRILKDTYKAYVDGLLDIQSQFRNCVDYIYNLNGIEGFKEHSANSKFACYVIQNNIYEYSENIEVILDNYAKLHNKYRYENESSLIKKIEERDSTVELHNVYTSPKLGCICFVILEQLVKQENILIKTCQNCGRYFIPTFRQNEIYCNLKNIDGTPTCRDKGANENYKKNLENTPALLLYRRTYQQKVMNVYRNKDNKQLKKSFEEWKKEAQEKIKLFKKGKLDEDTLYKWMAENK